jgi:hypothetical protein
VDTIEALGLLGQLQPDVLGPNKDGLEVHPLGLDLRPHLDHLGDVRHLALPLLRELEEGRDEARRHHRGQVHHLILERLDELLVGLEHKAALLVALEVLDDLKALDAPSVGNLVDAALDRELLARAAGDLEDLLLEALELHVEELLQRERLWVHVKLHLGDHHEALPVARAERVVLQVGDERQRSDKGGNGLLGRLVWLQ